MSIVGGFVNEREALARKKGIAELFVAVKPDDSNPSVQVFFLSLRGTLYIHLHNSGGVRPTVYLIKTESASTSVRMLRFSVETVDCDSTTGHKVLRKSGSLEFMKGVLSELVKQPASGSLEETKLRFSLSGLLNWGYRQDIELD